ncbi:hypothetical protein J4232_01990 [Candidatus Woesearchaeota archaeon]|nr:hypothetical protein [Candidatus Woesearchaeota archaeon]
MLEKQLSKLSKGIAALGLITVVESCGSTIFPTQGKNGDWYDCHSNVSYPVGHPCYEVIQKYNASKTSYSSNSSSSSSSSVFDKDWNDRGYDRDRSDRDKGQSGHKECVPKN